MTTKTLVERTEIAAQIVQASERIDKNMQKIQDDLGRIRSLVEQDGQPIYEIKEIDRLSNVADTMRFDVFRTRLNQWTGYWEARKRGLQESRLQA